MSTRTRRLRWTKIIARLGFLIAFQLVTACAVPVTPEPPVVVGTVQLARSSLSPERYVLTVPLLNRRTQRIDQFTLTAQALVAEPQEESRRRIDLTVPTSIPGNQRREERVVFDCPFPVVPVAGIELRHLRFTTFIVAGQGVPGEVEYPVPLRTAGSYE
jgi:hypothetical protein